MAGFFKRLLEEKFGRKSAPKEDAVEVASRTETPAPQTRGPAPADNSPAPSSPSYFVQIGLDFGTAYSKCVCRDVLAGSKAWVHRRPESVQVPGLPFLIPSALHYEDGIFTHRAEQAIGYSEHGLAHVKMALEKIALARWDDPVLEPFRRALGSGSDQQDLARFVEAAAVYLLAGIIGEVKADIPSHFPKGFVEGRIAVNMAVPVANANHPDVESTFRRVLCRAWVLAEKLKGFPETSSIDLQSKISAVHELASSAETEAACYIYPEVSANVQAFVRSRTSQEGIYLFSDTGAGTVDQSLFIFIRNAGDKDSSEKLTYLHADVLPLGSSHLEQRAAKHAGEREWRSLEKLRQIKENGDANVHVDHAKNEIRKELSDSTYTTIFHAYQKLHSKRQIDELRILFGGGGHIDNPYTKAVINRFTGPPFHPRNIGRRKSKGEPFDVGMPDPQDLVLGQKEKSWIKRLTVAYGLSFEKSELSSFKLPKDVVDPKPEDLWKPKREITAAPTKDEC